MPTQSNQPSGWVGWAYFASFMMIILGIIQAIEGLAGIFKGTYFVTTQTHLLVFNFRAWGWIDLVLGIIVFLAGLELLRGATWARIVAVTLAVLSFVANMSFVSAYPVWSIVMMVVDVLVIYALTVKGSELKEL